MKRRAKSINKQQNEKRANMLIECGAADAASIPTEAAAAAVAADSEILGPPKVM